MIFTQKQGKKAKLIQGYMEKLDERDTRYMELQRQFTEYTQLKNAETEQLGYKLQQERQKYSDLLHLHHEIAYKTADLRRFLQTMNLPV